MTDKFIRRVRIYSHISIVITFLVVLIVAAKPVVIPLIFSFLFAIVLNPWLKPLERLRIPRVLAILVVMLTFLIIISSFVAFSAYQLSMLLDDLPSIQRRIIELFSEVSASIENHLGLSVLGEGGLWEDAVKNAVPFFSGLYKTTSSFATFMVLIPIYTFLIMLYREKFTNFFTAVWKDSAQAKKRTDEVKSVIQNYVNGLLVIILILAVLNSVGLLLLDIQYALFFGIFSAVLTVIPYFGNLIGGLFPFLVALVTKDSAWYAVGVVAVYAFIQFLEGNFITPKIMGSQVSINPLAALLSLILGGHILGVAGIILAIPMVGILKAALSHSDTLRPLVILIEDKAKVRKSGP